MNPLIWIASKAGKIIASIAGLLIFVLTVFHKGKSAGKKEVKNAVNAKTTEKVIERVEEDRKIEKDNDALSDADVTAELLKHSRNRNNK